MTVAEMIEKAVADMGYPTVKEAARDLGIKYELLRKVVAMGHIPKDNQILLYAKKLNINTKLIVRRAHYERAPRAAREFLRDLA